MCRHPARIPAHVWGAEVATSGRENSSLSGEGKAMRDHICLERLQQADIIAEKRAVWTLPMICSFRIPEVVPGGARNLCGSLCLNPNWRRKTFVFSWVLIWMADSFLTGSWLGTLKPFINKSRNTGASSGILEPSQEYWSPVRNTGALLGIL